MKKKTRTSTKIGVLKGAIYAHEKVKTQLDVIKCKIQKQRKTKCYEVQHSDFGDVKSSNRKRNRIQRIHYTMLSAISD